MIVVLFTVIVVAAIVQISIASRDDVAPLEGPTSPGQLPSLPAATP
jgi:hypothetical protein